MKPNADLNFLAIVAKTVQSKEFFKRNLTNLIEALEDSTTELESDVVSFFNINPNCYVLSVLNQKLVGVALKEYDFLRGEIEFVTFPDETPNNETTVFTKIPYTHVISTAEWFDYLQETLTDRLQSLVTSDEMDLSLYDRVNP